MNETDECTHQCKKDVNFQKATPHNHSIADKELLQKRLKAVSLILFSGVAIFYIRNFYVQDQPAGLQLITLCLLAMSSGILMFKQFSMRFLRMIEVFVFSTMTFLLLAKYFTVIIEMGRNGQFSEVSLNQVYLCSALVNLIVVYGLFLPNNWRRTFVFVVLTSGAYFSTAIIINSSYHALDLVNLWTVSYFIFGAVIACYGSFVIHSLRKEVLNAKNVGSYRLLEKISSGGMGEVWKAEHQMLTRSAAVKLIHPELSESSENAVIRFEREAEAIAKLESPNTVQIYDFGITKSGDFYYAMELLNGLDLDDLIDNHGPLSIPRSVYILKQICKSLMEAHLKGLVHRDIKPANIFLCQRGCEYDFVKVLDFGMVKRDWDSQKITQQNIINGTPTFIAPEMINKGDSVDARADIYLVGCVAYWILTGNFVFFEENILATVLAHIKSTPSKISNYIEDFPQDLDNLIMSCLEKTPDKRPKSIKDIYLFLDKINCASPWDQEQAENWWITNVQGAKTVKYWS